MMVWGKWKQESKGGRERWGVGPKGESVVEKKALGKEGVEKEGEGGSCLILPVLFSVLQWR